MQCFKPLMAYKLLCIFIPTSLFAGMTVNAMNTDKQMK